MVGEGLLPYQLREHSDYLEVRLEGVIESLVTVEKAAPGRAGQRKVLLNCEAVTEVVADTYTLADQARRVEALGFLVAVYAPRPALFGLSRQVFLLAHVNEGVSAAVFSDLDAARQWLAAG